MKKAVRGIFVMLGFVCMGLGIVGTVIPVLPTVPFLICAAICFAKGSRRFHNWFVRTKVYREHLQTFVERRSMTRKKKLRALGLMTIMVGTTACFVPLNGGRVMLVCIILFNYWYFAKFIRTISEEEEILLFICVPFRHPLSFPLCPNSHRGKGTGLRLDANH